MNRKSMIGGLVGLLLLTGIVGANLVMANGGQNNRASVQTEEATSDNDNLECPDQGLPACAGQMNDEKGESPENEANDANEANEANEANDANDANDANEKGEGPENEANDANENDSHEDAEGANTANGEKP